MKQIRLLTRSYTDPDLHQRLINNAKKSTMEFKLSEIHIPKHCNKKLIYDYLEVIWSIKKNFIFYLFENEMVVHCPEFDESWQENPFNILRQYIQLGVNLASMNKRRLIVKSALLISVAISSAIIVLLSSVIPSLAAIIPTVIIPLLVMAIFVSIILICNMSLPGCAGIRAAKRELYECEERLKTTLDFFQVDRGQQPQSALIDSTLANPADAPPSTSSGYIGNFFISAAQGFSNRNVLPSSSCSFHSPS